MRYITCLLLFAALFLSFFTACKDDLPEENHYLLVGDLDAEGLVYYDFWGGKVIDPIPNQTVQEYFDINNDGINDFVIGCMHSTYMKEMRQCSMEALTESFQFISEWRNDTLVTSQETIGDTVYTLLETYNPAVHGEFTGGLTGGNFYVGLFSGHDTVTSGEAWHSPSIFTEYLDQTLYNGNVVTTYHQILGEWSGRNEKYVVFRLAEDGDVFYGWLKMSVSDYKKVVVYEYAYKRIMDR